MEARKGEVMGAGQGRVEGEQAGVKRERSWRQEMDWWSGRWAAWGLGERGEGNGCVLKGGSSKS